MVVETFPNLLDWILEGGVVFLILLVAGTLLGIILGFLVATFRHGPSEAYYSVAGVLASAPRDFIGTSPRRVWAIARLAMKEAFRRRVLLVTFMIFASILLFAGWYLTNVDHPERVYINFVMFGAQLLVLLVGLLISAFSIPEDIRNRTIFTVVTKPVRPTEIVIGRIVGFGLVVSGLLFAMGLASYLFVYQGLNHTHLVAGDTQTLASFQPVQAGGKTAAGGRVLDNAIMYAETTFDNGHRHQLELIEDIRDPAGPQPLDLDNVVSKTTRSDGKIVYRRVVMNPFGGHSHPVTVSGEGDNASINIGESYGYFRSRRPVYATVMNAYNYAGEKGGTSVGKEWGYRSYIDGGSSAQPETLARAEFLYDGLTPELFDSRDSVVIEMTLGVFRTYLGDIDKRVIASLQLESIPENPEVTPKLQSELIRFETNEMNIAPVPIQVKLAGRKIAPDGTIVENGVFDLFDDYASNGRIKLILRCEDINQYLGAARADVYFRSKDDVFWWNFIKGYIGLWCQMIIVVAIGVGLSTFLNTPVCILVTLVFLLVGNVSPFIRDLIKPDAEGGGPLEAFIRIIQQQNMIVSIETGWFTTFIEYTDKLILAGLNSLTYIAPNFANIDFSRYLTFGYAIANDRMLVAMLICLAFCFGSSIIGYFALKTREIAGKT